MEGKPKKEKKEVSPLEGKYVIANWQEVDTNGEIQATFLYKIVDGKAVTIFGPFSLNTSPGEGDKIYLREKNDYLSYYEYFLYLLEKNKIKEVYVVDEYKKDGGVMHEEIKSELGIGYGFVDMDDPGVDYGNDEINNWSELNSHIGMDTLGSLKILGVKVKSYNPETKEILDY